MRVDRPKLNDGPDGLVHQLGPAKGTAGMSHKRREHSELGTRQFELLPAE
jgi:hypothetical protein